MKNFGFNNLRLVAPPKNYKDAEARKMSLGAFDILKNSQVFMTLAEALHDINVSVGTSCGHQRDMHLTPLHELSSMLISMKQNRVAIIFGEERDGLNREELNLCHHVATIPSNPDFPSLNVAQSMGIVAYELSRARNMQMSRSTLVLDYVAADPGASVAADPGASVAPGASSEPGATVDLGVATNPAVNSLLSKTKSCLDTGSEVLFSTGLENDELFEQIDLLLHDVEFSRSFNRHSVIGELRSLYLRARPTAREAGMLMGAVSKIRAKLRAQESEK